MKEELYGLANHIAGAKGGLPQEWQEWADEIEMDIRKLANREAQPVAELVYSSAMPRFIGDTNEVEGYRCWIHGETRLVPTMEQAYADAKAVCTAPPAPAYPAPKDKSQGWKIDPEYLQAIADAVGCSDDEGVPSMELVEAILIAAATPAPAVNAVPDFEAWFNSPEAGLRVVNFHIQHELQLKAWNACRAAMLAQPVRSGYKLNSPEIPDGWVACSERMPEEGNVVLVYQEGGIIYCAEMQDGELYPDEFPRVPSEGREITHWMPLPAAPEGGNDHDTRR